MPQEVEMSDAASIYSQKRYVGTTKGNSKKLVEERDRKRENRVKGENGY